jgi:photosystem II stability/assembly factor-like uncharacterized protein
MNPHRLPRRTLLAAGIAAATFPARAAFTDDGPARVRPMAAKGALLDVALAGARLVAVGERGHVLLSDDQGKAWRQAKAVPTRTTLTSLFVADAKSLWATGHGGVILRSADGGETWNVAAGKANGPDVLLALRITPEGHGLAVGGFGVALATADGGATWKPQTLVGGEDGEKHLNRIVVTRAGTWLVAAEGGHVLRGSGGGAVGSMQWTPVKTPYAGSLWTGLSLSDGSVLMGGMRGNVVRSADDGRTWTHQAIAEAGSLTGSAALADGRPLLVGVDGTMIVGDAAAGSFRMQRLEDRGTLTAVVALPGGALVAAGLAGMRTLEVPK